MDEKTMMWAALIVGGIVVFMLARSGSGGGIRTLAPLPEAGGSSTDRTQAFLALADYEKAKLDYGLGTIQAGIESQRIAAAETASLYQTQAQLAASQAQSRAQSSSSIWGTIASIGAAVIAAL